MVSICFRASRVGFGDEDSRGFRYIIAIVSYC